MVEEVSRSSPALRKSASIWIACWFWKVSSSGSEIAPEGPRNAWLVRLSSRQVCSKAEEAVPLEPKAASIGSLRERFQLRSLR